MNSLIMGIDNGSSGSWCVVDTNSQIRAFGVNPSIEDLDYLTSRVSKYKRLDEQTFATLLCKFAGPKQTELSVVLEKPSTRGMYGSDVKAARYFESQLVVLRQLRIGYKVINSKVWQSRYLPTGTKPKQTKFASLHLGCQMYPAYAEAFTKQKDADALFIALSAIGGE